MRVPVSRRLLLLLLPAVLLLGLHGWAAPVAAVGGDGTAVTWPVDPPVVLRGFAPPAVDWQPGHRGVDLAAPVGTAVVAPATGTVTFASRLAGRGVVVVALADGLRTTLEPVSAKVDVGDPVTAGEVVGTVEPGPHCGWTPCLHWGLRRGDAYLDPRLLLGLAPPVLLPLDATLVAAGDPRREEPGPMSAAAPGVGLRGGSKAARRPAGHTGVAVAPSGDGSLPADRRLLAGLGELAA
jgi:murein DD-endopeptidase MepM/ murein hydrolase activator NlpD